MTTPRHEYYETDERITVSIFDRNADPAQVSLEFEPRKVTYTNGDKLLALEPLKGQVNPDSCEYTVGKVKVELRLLKAVQGRWGGLIGDTPDPLANSAAPETTPRRPQQKNWEGISSQMLASDKEVTLEEDPNVGGDSAINPFFQKLFSDADEDTKRAMLKSYSESGGTTLSTNWDEVRKGKVEVKPPEGSEWKRWG
ncbi:hypothetical protein E1B28_001054 [Marasmius oreades]|uniref:Uncharacterized protein n=1 Tax=Marasmius oreades TaxID=181124 RepID=A0A9P7V2P3_9AGAR|nr:uncharacterized protein E1B28_001054 [Marasmius oreades]KAG7099185.1 hypothetical protein E1B28_001054 [Marasmius oreades]